MAISNAAPDGGAYEKQDSRWVRRGTEKYFPVGLFGVPGYDWVRSDQGNIEASSADFADAADFNLFVVQNGRIQPHMDDNGASFLAGKWKFPFRLRGCTDRNKCGYGGHDDAMYRNYKGLSGT